LSLILLPASIFLVANKGATNGSGCSPDKGPSSRSTSGRADKRTTSRSGSTTNESTLFAVTQWL
jgi:hypothetical protein